MSTELQRNDSDSTQHTTSEPSQKPKRVGDVKVIITIISVLIPLVIGYFEYKESIDRSQHTIFREIVKDLSSNEKQNRVSGATNLGAYIRENNKYRSVATNLLINFIGLESDVDVLNAISLSLKNVDIENYYNVLNKLLELNRSMFLNDYVTSRRVIIAKENFRLGMEDMSAVVTNLPIARSTTNAPSPIQPVVEKEWSQKIAINELSYIYNLKKVHLNMEERRMLTANFVAGFLALNPGIPKKVEFRQSPLNEILLENVNLSYSTLVDSAFGKSSLKNINFSHSTVDNTIFTDTLLDNINFSNSTFISVLFDLADLPSSIFKDATLTDVFFLDANIENSDFTGAKGLKPVYFYKAHNVDKAIFDDTFRKQLAETEVTFADYSDYIEKSTLSFERQQALRKTLAYYDPVYSGNKNISENGNPDLETKLLEQLIFPQKSNSLSEQKTLTELSVTQQNQESHDTSTTIVENQQ